jgi:putative peptide zinc metalloprotease protein
MATAAPAASDVERRKKVRIRIRRDLNIAPQKYEGRTYYVVKDPVSMRYYRFKEQEHFLINLMDGDHTLDDAQKEYEKRFRPERLTLEDLEGFAQQLLTAGLAQNESPQAGKQLFDRRKKRRRSEVMQALTNILYIKIPITNLLVYFNLDLDRILARMLRHLGWIFTTWFMTLSVAWMLSAVLLVATHFETFREKLPSYHEFFSFSTVGYLWLALAVVKVIHEFGHGLSCKAFGGEVHEMGLLFLVFSPCMYCNVSDAWTLPSKWKRIIISFAGIYVELIIAATATWIWWNTPSQPFVNNLSLSLMVVCSVSTVVFNANPLMRYDGYYILADLLEIPNLRDRSNRFLQRLVMEHCLGIEVQPEQYMALWRRVMFVLYAIISYIYRWVITFSILYFMSMFLKPYKLGAISGMLALAAGGSMVGWPLYRLGKNLHKRGRLPDMKPVRVTLSTIALTSIILFLFLVPLPVSRVRQLALVQVEPEYIEKETVPYPGGILEACPIRDGQEVKKGDLLAVFRSLDEENRLAQSQAERDRYQLQVTDLTRLMTEQGDVNPDARAKLETQIAEARGKLATLVSLVQQLESQQRRLEVKASRDGTVMSPPRTDEVGKLYEKGAVLCSIGDLSHMRVWMPIPSADYRILERDRADLQKSQKDIGDLPVSIRVQGHAERVWHGKITLLPESPAKKIPVQLSNKAGGDIAAKPPTRSEADQLKTDAEGVEPQGQFYLVGISIIDPGNYVCPGTMAYVKVACKYRTAAWWAWRKFNTAFDLGMDPADWVPGALRAQR